MTDTSNRRRGPGRPKGGQVVADRTQLLEAAAEVIRSQGPDATMDDIAAGRIGHQTHPVSHDRRQGSTRRGVVGVVDRSDRPIGEHRQRVGDRPGGIVRGGDTRLRGGRRRRPQSVPLRELLTAGHRAVPSSRRPFGRFDGLRVQRPRQASASIRAARRSGPGRSSVRSRWSPRCG